ncbi:MAG: Asp-tRNA(Asn)/Glu-tRNA(Gln) amidotransferase subunit GatB [Candidatus Hodarchaeota archaeon]
MTENYEDVIIGLETHIQLSNLKTKFFCGCNSDYYGKEPNTYVCPGCLGFPGILPLINKRALEFATRLALALECKINKSIFFFRKQYYYPDMARNFQLTLYNKLGGNAFADGGIVPIKINGIKKNIKLNRIHLEEDPARLVHKGSITISPYTLVDYNRSGIALIEIVTDPVIRSPEEAREYLNQLKSIIQYTGISDLNIEGTCRVDANISIKGSARVEVKNINSFKEVERALKWEIRRHRQMIERGKALIQETRGWDEKRRITVEMRKKEFEEDYRYYPEQDLPKIELDDEFIENVKKQMPEMPMARSKRLQEAYHLSEFDADLLVLDKNIADFYEEGVQIDKNFEQEDYKLYCNWVMNDVARWLNENNKQIKETSLKPKQVVDLINLIKVGKITTKIAKTYIDEMMKGIPISTIIKKSGKVRIADEKFLEDLCRNVIEGNPKIIEDYRKNPKAKMALVGKIMKETKGQADPELANDILDKLLKEFV